MIKSTDEYMVNKEYFVILWLKKGKHTNKKISTTITEDYVYHRA